MTSQWLYGAFDIEVLAPLSCGEELLPTWAVPERPGVERTPPIPRRRKRCARIALQPEQNSVGGFSRRSACRGKISVVETLSGDSEPPTPTVGGSE